MEMGGGIVESLKDKCILVTGSTGFLAKIFVEKILRVQPEVKKLFLILRAPVAKSASQRFRTEIVGKELFDSLRESYGSESGLFETFISSKLFPVAGDIVEEDFGIEDATLLDTMRSEIDVVVNVAATTNFNERYDVALGVNVLGAKHALEFAKKCPKIEMLLHVSTAYVAGSQEGLQLEKKFRMGETLNGTKGLDIDGELSLATQALEDIRSNGSTTTEREETSAMRDLGRERAQYFGWPNAYVFTKAMAEMLLGHMRGDLPLVIVRPTIITSIINDPLPGWMEGGARTIDSVIIGYARGKLPCFLGDLNLIMDVIPGDMVANAMLVAAATHLNRPSEHIYHVGSSARNPVKYSSLLDNCHRYFTANPQVGRDGRTARARRIPVINNMAKFRSYMNVRLGLPLEGLRLLNLVSCNAFSRRYNELERKFNFVMRLAELYAPFALFNGSFDDTNMKNLGKSTLLQASNAEVVKIFQFDPKSIDWDHYLLDIHIPGILKHVMK